MTGTIQNRGPQPRTAPAPQGQQRTVAAVLTLPTYYGLALDDVKQIADNVLEIVGEG